MQTGGDQTHSLCVAIPVAVILVSIGPLFSDYYLFVCLLFFVLIIVSMETLNHFGIIYNFKKKKTRPVFDSKFAKSTRRRTVNRKNVSDEEGSFEKRRRRTRKWSSSRRTYKQDVRTEV